jgi:hypothetical protein
MWPVLPALNDQIATEEEETIYCEVAEGVLVRDAMKEFTRQVSIRNLGRMGKQHENRENESAEIK